MACDHATGKRKVLLCLDLSEHSVRALNWFLGEMHLPDDDVILFHALEPTGMSGTALGMSSSQLADAYSSSLAQAKHEFDDLKRLFARQIDGRVPPERAHIISVVGAKPGELACKYVHKHHVDAIVVGNRGRSRSRRTILGSVSEYILHHAHTPVAVVPAQPDCATHNYSSSSLSLDKSSMKMCQEDSSSNH